MTTLFPQLPPVAHWTRVDLPKLEQLADTMVQTSCRSSLVDGPLVIGLVGTLGAGKTRFCQELARAFEIPPGDVTSPTFTLQRSYVLPTRPAENLGDVDPNWPQRWHHLDLYRVGDEDELWELGLEELWEDRGAWTVMEWADRFANEMPPETVWIEMQVTDEGPADTREVIAYCSDVQRASWLTEVAEAMNLPKKT